MAKKSNVNRYPAELSYPVMAWANALDPGSTPLSDEEIWREKLRRLLILAQHYAVDVSAGTAGAFATLTMRVLEDFDVPGFQVAATPQDARKWSRRRNGRPSGTGKMDRFRVLVAVEIVRARPEFTVWTACQFLSKTQLFKKLKPVSLQRAYYKALAERANALTVHRAA